MYIFLIKVSGKLNLENSFDVYILFTLFCQLPEIDKGHRHVLAAKSCSREITSLPTLSSVLQKVEKKHAKWFQEACQIAEKLGITVQKPRTCQVQHNRANTSAETIEDHYRRNLTIPLG